MNPYETSPARVPSTDLYADIPQYGRYRPEADDVTINPEYIGSTSPEAVRYWASVLDLCDQSARIYPAEEGGGGRDVFALGSVIVKSSHLHKSNTSSGDAGGRVDYSFADKNEVEAIALARGLLREMGVRVPEIYFAGMIRDHQVLIQERLPGVALAVAWPYLAQAQKQSFKEQARDILRQLHIIKPVDGRRARSHVVQDPDILSNGRLNPLEGELIFSDTGNDEDLGFMHNDLTLSNIIVDDGKIVGLIDWEMAGYIGWKTAGEIHRRIRSPQKENFKNAGLTEDELEDMLFWNDLYYVRDGIDRWQKNEKSNDKGEIRTRESFLT